MNISEEEIEKCCQTCKYYYPPDEFQDGACGYEDVGDPDMDCILKEYAEWVEK